MLIQKKFSPFKLKTCSDTIQRYQRITRRCHLQALKIRRLKLSDNNKMLRMVSLVSWASVTKQVTLKKNRFVVLFYRQLVGSFTKTPSSRSLWTWQTYRSKSLDFQQQVIVILKLAQDIPLHLIYKISCKSFKGTWMLMSSTHQESLGASSLTRMMKQQVMIYSLPIMVMSYMKVSHGFAHSRNSTRVSYTIQILCCDIHTGQYLTIEVN